MSLRTRRIAFVFYAVLLFVATHWPKLRIDVPRIERPDLLIHMAAFGLWFVLVLQTQWLGPWRSARAILACVVIAAIYACFDEGTQAIPILGRTSALDDLLANLAGIAAAAIFAAVLANIRNRATVSTPDRDLRA